VPFSEKTGAFVFLCRVEKIFAPFLFFLLPIFKSFYIFDSIK